MKAIGIHPDISIKDERLDIDQLDHYLLSFFIGTQVCEIAIFDERKKRMLLLESYSLDEQKSLLENLKEIHHDHALISAGFWKRVEITLRNHKFCQVPNELYSGEHAYDYLKLNAPVDPLKEKYLSLLDKAQGCTTAFSVPHDIMRWFDGKYPKPAISYTHESAAFISTCWHYVDSKVASQLLVNLTKTDMQVTGYAAGKLAIYNEFSLQSPQKAAKLLLMALQQFSKEGQSTPVMLWGRDEHVKEYLPLLKKYYKNLELGGRPKGIRMGHPFDESKDHEYFDIIGSYL